MNKKIKSCTLMEKYIRLIKQGKKPVEARVAIPMFENWQAGDTIRFFSRRNPRIEVIVKIVGKNKLQCFKNRSRRSLDRNNKTKIKMLLLSLNFLMIFFFFLILIIIKYEIAPTITIIRLWEVWMSVAQDAAISLGIRYNSNRIAFTMK